MLSTIGISTFWTTRRTTEQIENAIAQFLKTEDVVFHLPGLEGDEYLSVRIFIVSGGDVHVTIDTSGEIVEKIFSKGSSVLEEAAKYWTHYVRHYESIYLTHLNISTGD